MTSSRRTSTRIAGAVIAVVFVGAVGAAAALASSAGLVSPAGTVPPALTREPLALTALPEPTASQISCVGPVLAVGRDATDAALLTDAASQDVSAATAPGQPDAAASRLSAVDVSGGAGPDALTAQPDAGVRTDVAAAGSATVADEDLAGFAASTCAPALMESWLVGGSGATGAADLLLLANPSGVASEVDITVYGAEGATQPAAAAGIIVPPGTQRVLPLAALALGQASPVIRVNAAGAPIQASMQTSITRTLLTGGIDQVGTTAAPATTQVIPSVDVLVAPGEEGASEPATALRVLAPSDDTEASVRVTPVAGGAGESSSLSLLAGVPAEFDLGDLQPGAYRVEVTADRPVVAGLWATTGFGEGADFVWHSVPSPFDVPSLVAVAVGPSPMLTIGNDADADVTVRLTGPTGDTDVTVGAHASVRVPVVDAAVYQVSPDGAHVRANITFSGPGEAAGYAVTPADAAAEPVIVYPQ